MRIRFVLVALSWSLGIFLLIVRGVGELVLGQAVQQAAAVEVLEVLNQRVVELEKALQDSEKKGGKVIDDRNCQECCLGTMMRMENHGMGMGERIW
jgi:hypothetical protein